MECEFEPHLSEKCVICGDFAVKNHYGVFSCYGCKGFFRRAVRNGRNKYVCRKEKNCVVDSKQDRNGCRYCRFRACLQAGMNPDAVRPEREALRLASQWSDADRRPSDSSSSGHSSPRPQFSLTRTSSASTNSGDWTKNFTDVERSILVGITRLSKTIDEFECASFFGIDDFTLSSLVEFRSMPRSTLNVSFCSIDRSISAVWRIVNHVDWVEGLVRLTSADEQMIQIGVHDKTCLVRHTFMPLTILTELYAIATRSRMNELVAVRKTMDALGLSFSTNEILRRLACETLVPLRHASLSPIDLQLLKAIIVFNPDCPGVCSPAAFCIKQIRACLYDLLFKSVANTRPLSSQSAAANYGHVIALLAPLAHVSGMISKELRTCFPRTGELTSLHALLRTDVFNPQDICESTAQERAGEEDKAKEIFAWNAFERNTRHYRHRPKSEICQYDSQQIWREYLRILVIPRKKARFTPQLLPIGRNNGKCRIEN